MSAVCTGILLFVQLQGVSTGPVCIGMSHAERLAVAQAVQGEVSVLGNSRIEAGTWIVHVALNRRSSPWFPDDLVGMVEDGFHGADRESDPAPWAFEAVDLALAQRAANHDPTKGALFALGGIDLCSCVDFSKRLGYIIEGDFSVHIFREWPIMEGCAYE